MKDRRRRLVPTTLTVLLAGAALVGPAAAQRPDDRAGPLGVGAVSNATGSTARPDDRGGPLGVGSVAAAIPLAATRPDDRDAVRGPVLGGSAAAATAAPLRPDDRDGLRGPVLAGTAAAPAATMSDGFVWRDAFFGAGATLGLVMLAGLLTLTVRARGRMVTP
jgi:hypothetical protein